MKKHLIILIALLVCGTINNVSAQTIKDNGHRTVAYVDGNGCIQNSNRVAIGYIRNDGIIQDSNRNVIGYICSNGSIQDSRRVIIGYVKDSGEVQDKNHRTIGYVKGDGQVLDSSHRIIGYAQDILRRVGDKYTYSVTMKRAVHIVFAITFYNLLSPCSIITFTPFECIKRSYYTMFSEVHHIGSGVQYPVEHLELIIICVIFIMRCI